jgi:hypothetical protein
MSVFGRKCSNYERCIILLTFITILLLLSSFVSITDNLLKAGMLLYKKKKKKKEKFKILMYKLFKKKIIRTEQTEPTTV